MFNMNTHMNNTAGRHTSYCKRMQGITVNLHFHTTRHTCEVKHVGVWFSFCSTRSIPSVHDEYISRVARFDIFRVHTVNSSTVIGVLLDNTSNRLFPEFGFVWIMCGFKSQKCGVGASDQTTQTHGERSTQARAHTRSFDFQFVQRN